MAAYVAYLSLASLSNLMMQIRNHPRVSTFFDKNQIQNLVENVEFLLDFVETYNFDRGPIDEEAQLLTKQVASEPYYSDLHTSSMMHFMDHQYVENFLYLLDIRNSRTLTTKGVEDLEKLIASAANAAEYLTENYIKDQIVGGSTKKERLAFLHALHKLIVYMDFLKEKVMKVKKILGSKEKQPTYSVSAASSRRFTTANTNSMVELDDELKQLTDLLTRQPSGRIIISIVGMAGIGKTTLARSAFQHLLIKENFDLCLWATISQEYSVRGILLQLLSFMQQKFTSETMQELGDKLYKSLCGRRYMIVLDDMWDINVWDEIKRFLPNNGTEKSGITITTRLSRVATHCSSSYITMKLLDEDKSWKLFCEKAFGEEECHELKEIGKEIVKKCRGLPLSIVVIGGHLRNSLRRTKEYWLEVANDINSVLNSGDQEEQCMSILSLSYNHLPAYLKPCFISIGLFSKEDEDIDASRIRNIWIAKGFLKKSEMLNWKDAAEVCLGDLLDRNLIVVYERYLDGIIQTFKIHDLLRDLCTRVCKKESLLCTLKLPPQDLKNCSSDLGVLDTELVDTFTIENEVDVVYPRTKFEQVCLRYLECTIFKTAPCLYLHSSIFLLWNLKILNITAEENVLIMAPSEFWEMPNLMQLAISPRTCVPDPPPRDHQQDYLVLHNLQTLGTVYNFRLSEEVCKRIPNIANLMLCYDVEASSSPYYCLHNLCCLKQLKTLFCDFKQMLKWSDSALNLPSSLNVLTLRSRYLDWDGLTMIAKMVPGLEVLELQFWDSNIGEFKGEFPCLNSLSITGGGDFVEWNADESQFPVLNNLILRRYRLAEIPPGILEISTLEFVSLEECSASAAISAVKIQVEQVQDFGNKGFRLQLQFWTPSEEERFWKMIEEEDLTSANVVVKSLLWMESRA